MPHTAPEQPHNPPTATLVEAGKQLLTTFYSMFQTRAAMAGVELAEEKERLLHLA